MVKAERNTYYKGTNINFFLYIDNDYQVGFGFSIESAKQSCGLHNHWLDNGKFRHNDILERMGFPQLENK